jgi:hypothetical protein
MIEGHGDAPIAHGAGPVGARHLGKCPFGLVIPKGVQQRHRAVERFLGRGITRRREMDGAEIMAGVMLIIRGEGAGKNHTH